MRTRSAVKEHLGRRSEVKNRSIRMRGGGIKNCQGGVRGADKGREDRQGCGKSEVVVGRFWVDIGGREGAGRLGTA